MPPILQLSPAPYSQGWPNISAALLKRLQAIPGIGKTYDFTKLVRSNALTEEYWEAFFKDGIPNHWIFNRIGGTPPTPSPEDPRIFTRRHNVQLQGFYGYSGKEGMEEKFQALVDAIGWDWALGDTTLGGNCVNLQRWEQNNFGVSTIKSGLNCYTVEWKFGIEEAICPVAGNNYASLYTEVGPQDPFDSQVPGPVSIGSKIGDLLIAWLNSECFVPGKLPLAIPMHWSRSMESETSYPAAYPANPYLQLPRARLRMTVEDISLGDPTAGRDAYMKLSYSIFLHLLQPKSGTVAAMNHQRNLKRAMEYVANMISGAAFQPNAIDTEGMELIDVTPQTIIHDEIRHEWDNPGTRVSVGEVLLTLNGKITNY